LPPELGQLTNLRTLNVTFNSLTGLPPELGQLANLQTLDLSDNNLEGLPSELGQLTNLRRLSLSGSGNFLAERPVGLAASPTLPCSTSGTLC